MLFQIIHFKDFMIYNYFQDIPTAALAPYADLGVEITFMNMKKNEMTTRSNSNENERLDDLDSSQKADNQNENYQISAVSIQETFRVLNQHKNLVYINFEITKFMLYLKNTFHFMIQLS